MTDTSSGLLNGMMYIGNSGSGEEERSMGGAVNATRPKLDQVMGRGRPTGPNARRWLAGHRASSTTRSMASVATMGSSEGFVAVPLYSERTQSHVLNREPWRGAHTGSHV